MTQTTNCTTMNVTDAYRFIESYVSFEKLPLPQAKSFFAELLRPYPEEACKEAHLLDQWIYKQQSFGAFWLNLDASTKVLLLQAWGFDMPDAANYLKHVHMQPLSAMWLDPPLLVRSFNDLLLYFENHSISAEPSEDLQLGILPPARMQFGSASNWGRYLLMYGDQRRAHLILATALTHYERRREQR